MELLVEIYTNEANTSCENPKFSGFCSKWNESVDSLPSNIYVRSIAIRRFDDPTRQELIKSLNIKKDPTAIFFVQPDTKLGTSDYLIGAILKGEKKLNDPSVIEKLVKNIGATDWNSAELENRTTATVTSGSSSVEKDGSGKRDEIIDADGGGGFGFGLFGKTFGDVTGCPSWLPSFICNIPVWIIILLLLVIVFVVSPQGRKYIILK